jgi:ATP-dependent helicase/nuclease subunit A
LLEQNESRRCARPVLDIVNRVFAQEPMYAADFRAHGAHDPALPGRVEVLPLAVHEIVAEEADEPSQALRDPLTTPAQDDEDLRRELEAGQLVGKLDDILANWEIVASASAEGRHPVTYSDIMILVRRRTHLHVYERALRRARIPFVTSRQGGLLETLEVQDLLALLGFLVSPFDDLKLAHALRSPIFDCTDDDLMNLAQGAGTWWSRLDGWTDLDPGSALGRARELLARWLERADRLPVHDHLDKIYFEGDVERRYASAVPVAVRDAVIANLHAFIEHALALDSGRYPSLPRFLDELKDLDRVPAEEAPDEGGVDDGGNAVRILTVHGAKGLEAPIVVLIDTASGVANDRGYDCLVDWPTGDARPRAFSMRTRRDEWNSRQREQMDSEAASDERENLNLLYVAMTRARQALIVSGCENGRSGTTWYDRIRGAVAAQIGNADDVATGLLTHGADMTSDVARRDLQREPSAASAFEPIRLPAIMPVGRRRDTAMSLGQRYGTAFHRVMECLAADPGADAEAIASHFDLTSDEALRCAAQARRLICNAALRRFFDSRQYIRAFNELPLVEEGGAVRRIDRLVEFADEVWVIDYKTGGADPRMESEFDTAYRDQVGAYCRSIQSVYPARRIRGALVFADGEIVEVSGETA